MTGEPPVPRDLTIPEPGSTTARTVLSRALGRLAGELSSAHRRAPLGARAEAGILQRLVGAARTSAPGPLASALRRPTIGGLLRCLRHEALPQQEAIFVELVAQLAFELAIAGALPEPVRLTRFPPRLLSLPARLALALAPGTRALLFERGRLTVEHGGGAAPVDLEALAGDPAAGPAGGTVVVERPYHAISGAIVLALADNNPLALVEAHPDKAGNAVDLGGHRRLRVDLGARGRARLPSSATCPSCGPRWSSCSARSSRSAGIR